MGKTTTEQKRITHTKQAVMYYETMDIPTTDERYKRITRVLYGCHSINDIIQKLYVDDMHYSLSLASKSILWAVLDYGVKLMGDIHDMEDN